MPVKTQHNMFLLYSVYYNDMFRPLFLGHNQAKEQPDDGLEKEAETCRCNTYCT